MIYFVLGKVMISSTMFIVWPARLLRRALSSATLGVH
jgi:hypothetical protein